MGIRPAKCYRAIERPYTRVSQRKPRKSYVKGVPASKINKFELGKKGDYKLRLNLISEHSVQIRHNALEAIRMATNKVLEKHIGPDMYYFKLFPYPHHVLRENPLATGAGADRFSTGMRQSFGKPIATAAQVKRGQILLSVWCTPDKAAIAKKALIVSSKKIPTTSRITVEHLA